MNKKPIKDPNLFAKSVFENLLDKLDPEAASKIQPQSKAKSTKKQAAGRKGGLKGGQSRAEKLPPEKRKAIAKKAAQSRWQSKA